MAQSQSHHGHCCVKIWLGPENDFVPSVLAFPKTVHIYVFRVSSYHFVSFPEPLFSPPWSSATSLPPETTDLQRHPQISELGTVSAARAIIAAQKLFHDGWRKSPPCAESLKYLQFRASWPKNPGTEPGFFISTFRLDPESSSSKMMTCMVRKTCLKSICDAFDMYVRNQIIRTTLHLCRKYFSKNFDLK